MRCQLTGLLILAAPAALAQTRADSALIARILAAEDRRDTSLTAYSEGLASADPRIRLIAGRSFARVKDPRFASRDSLPSPVAPPNYPDPAWRLRFRELTPRADCAIIERGFVDRDPRLRMRAMDVMPATCMTAADKTQLENYSSFVPKSAMRRQALAGWQVNAHALVALARLAPGDARRFIPDFAQSPVPWARAYAARAARQVADTATLRRLAADANDNVKEAAIDGLAATAGHSADDIYLRALGASGYQVIRAAAIALKGSPRGADVIAAGQPVLARLRGDSSETSRDARVALADRLREAGIANASADLITAPRAVPLGTDAVALALGKQVVLRVTLADSSGGGHFDVRLRGDVAPIMAARVLDLVRAGWYDNRTWYRVEPDFVIQGGGPGSNEYVGHPRFMRDELSSLPHVRGTVGMSTRGHDTGDAQWFVNLRDNQRLTRDYTSFGDVIDGIDVVDGILEGDVIARIEVIGSRPPSTRP